MALGAAILTPDLAQAAPAVCRLSEKGVLPVRFVGRTPVVDVEVNGRREPLIADSGAAANLLTAEAAQAVNLEPDVGAKNAREAGLGGLFGPGAREEAAEVPVNAGSPVDAREVRNAGGDVAGVRFEVARRVSLAGVSFADVPFGVLRASFGEAADGVLGREFLHGGAVEFDLSRGRIRLFEARGCGDRIGRAYWLGPGEGYNSVDLLPSSAADPPLEAMVEVNGRRLRAVFDTGAGATTLSRRAAERLGLQDARLVGRARQPLGPGLSLGEAAVQSVRVGDERIYNTRLLVADLKAGPDLIIGADFFRSHRIILSPDARRMDFTYEGGPVFALGGVPRRAASAPDVGAPPHDPA